MECHEGATMIKTFRGLIVDGGQDTVVLHSNDGSAGYRIVKFQIFPNQPGLTDYESLVQIFKVPQTTVPTGSATTDFSNQTLLGANYVVGNNDTYAALHTIFDQEIFNQDIYVTHTANTGSASINYYIELEQVKLDLNESTVATLKDIRNLEQPPPG